jgi:hypothetical protein
MPNRKLNGLLRQYFPKSTDLSVHTAGDLRRVASKLNRRPRGGLGDRTPAEAMRERLDNTNNRSQRLAETARVEGPVLPLDHALDDHVGDRGDRLQGTSSP